MEKVHKTIRSFYYYFDDEPRTYNSYAWVYKVVAFLGVLFRAWIIPIIIPEPFELLTDIIIGQFGFPSWIYYIVRYLALAAVDYFSLSRIFYKTSYRSVGNMYCSRTRQYWWGSLLYTIFYTIYMIIAWLLIEYFIMWVIILIAVVYLLLCIMFYIISNKIDTMPDNVVGRTILHIILFALILTALILIKIHIFP